MRNKDHAPQYKREKGWIGISDSMQFHFYFLFIRKRKQQRQNSENFRPFHFQSFGKCSNMFSEFKPNTSPNHQISLNLKNSYHNENFYQLILSEIMASDLSNFIEQYLIKESFSPKKNSEKQVGTCVSMLLDC